MRCVISLEMVRQFYANLKEKAPFETGGILLGHIDTEGSWVVSWIVGPGINAVHRRLSFEPDYKYHSKIADDAWNESQGTLYYLGDWHTHPGGPALASELDVRCLAGIANSPTANVPRPLMVIVGSNPQAIAAFTYIDGRMIALPVDVCPS